MMNKKTGKWKVVSRAKRRLVDIKILGGKEWEGEEKKKYRNG